MNKPTHPEPPFAPAFPPYELDGYGWAMAQAQLLRERRFDAADWDKIIEEIESVGRSEYDQVESALRVLLLHLLKWEYQPAFRSRSWFNTIREHHRRYRRRLDRNPGLKQHLEEIRAEAYRQARVEAVAETGFAEDTFPIDPPGWNVIENPPVSFDDIPIR
ncbi:DUF29 family protein [Sphingomonas sp. MAH-20]|uniref:DUF29 family protein n=1 Tax=Sphingomonas horti TaxID=2682842 RepID=A0A6I4J1V7_9SPHN|nr:MULTISPECIES: DUF29 domain-containing protein [Sphingomonas]MBA2918534.1 DUF29 domain-containing protein [Sphingomonas sp. CGMCC 1.13658]MVO77501.1 DUF29 family protein [Sphingomonas horti]